MNQLFSSGSEVANLVVSSGLLRLSWDKIWDSYEVNLNEQGNESFFLRWKVYQEDKSNIIVFITSPICTKSHLQEAELVSSTALKENFPFFEFLCSDGYSFSLHKAAITLFGSHINDLLQLKNQCSNSSNPLIITGHSLGGSVASLFTLWLLESLDVSAAKHPLCLTFGSPLVGDKGFEEAISAHPIWTSCFLHVVASEDPIPRLFITPHSLDNMGLTSQSNPYWSFGTFLLCCEIGCTCSENPEVDLELMAAMSSGGLRNEEQLVFYYGLIVEKLESLLIFKGSQLSDSMPNSLRAGTILQLEAIGLSKRQHQNADLDNIMMKLEKLEETCLLNKRDVLDPAKKLNDIKIRMAFLGWYKKVSKAGQVGYYDCYKNQLSRRDRDVVRYKMFLTNYWKEFVAQAEKKLQKRPVYFRARWLYAGAAYRRMVEPLDIAEYYQSGQKNYLASGRSDHYIKMEQWLEEAEKKSGVSTNTKKQNVDAILTYDSCFWAHVEEARLCCKSLGDADASAMERESSRQNLMKFELYVMEQIKNCEVSSEIFLKNSSFMQWWKEYEKIIGPNYQNLPLTDFMKNCEYQQYASGCLALN